MSHDPEGPAHAEALRLLDRRQYHAAIALQRLIEEDSSGTAHALLGVAHFQLEEYDRAADHYRSALARDPGHVYWKEMLARSQANATAEIHVPVPEPWYFEREKLLATPVVAHGALPETPPALPSPGITAILGE